MERFVVTHTELDLWSVSYQERILYFYRTEYEALSCVFRLASSARWTGSRTVVVITGALPVQSGRG